MLKEIRVECEGAGRETKIYLDNEDLLKKITGIYGVKFQVFVHGVTELKLYQRGKPFEFTGKVKVIEIFGQENYCLVERGYIEELKKWIKHVADERKKTLRETNHVLEKNEELEKEINALKAKLEKNRR